MHRLYIQTQTQSCNIDVRLRPNHLEAYNLLVRAVLTWVTLTICARLTAEATFHEHVHIRVHVPEITNEIHHKEAVVKEIPIIRHRQRHRYRSLPRHRHRYRHKHEKIIPASAMTTGHLYHDDDDDIVDVDDHYTGSASAHTAYARYNELDDDYDGGVGVGVVNYRGNVDFQNADLHHRNSYFIDDNDDNSHLFHDRAVNKPQLPHHASTLLTATSAGAEPDEWSTATGVGLSILTTPATAATQVRDEKNKSAYYEMGKNYVSALASTHPNVWPHVQETSSAGVDDDSLRHAGVAQYYHTAPAVVTMPDRVVIDNNDHFAGRQLHAKKKLKNYSTTGYAVVPGKFLHPGENINGNDYYTDV